MKHACIHHCGRKEELLQLTKRLPLGVRDRSIQRTAFLRCTAWDSRMKSPRRAKTDAFCTIPDVTSVNTFLAAHDLKRRTSVIGVFISNSRNQETTWHTPTWWSTNMKTPAGGFSVAELFQRHHIVHYAAHLSFLFRIKVQLWTKTDFCVACF